MSACTLVGSNGVWGVVASAFRLACICTPESLVPSPVCWGGSLIPITLAGTGNPMASPVLALTSRVITGLPFWAIRMPSSLNLKFPARV